jgi:hypothetical protein
MEERNAAKFPFVAPSRDFSSICANLGTAIAANTPMIATTIISSISVKPFFALLFLFLIFSPPFYLLQP